MEYGLAIVFALFVWWFSTGAVLYVVGLPPRTFGWSMGIASGLLVLALIGFTASSRDTSVSGAYCAFTCALLVWAWHEMSFLTGYVTGPRREPCPTGTRGWQRFLLAVDTLLYHELAIVVTVVLLTALAWNAPNQFGVVTFLVLWLLRISAKLNVFLGVPNLTEEFLPKGLEFLKSYFGKRPMNLLFPLSITLSTLATAMFVQAGFSAGVSSFEVAGYTLIASLMALAVLEHWLLILPLPAAALWSWGLKSRERRDAKQESARPVASEIWIKNETQLISSSGR